MPLPVLKLICCFPVSCQWHYRTVWVFPYSSRGANSSQSIRQSSFICVYVFVLCYSVLKKDPYHSSCLPVHISCLVELKKVNSKCDCIANFMDMWENRAVLEVCPLPAVVQLNLEATSAPYVGHGCNSTPNNACYVFRQQGYLLHF